MRFWDWLNQRLKKKEKNAESHFEEVEAYKQEIGRLQQTIVGLQKGYEHRFNLQRVAACKHREKIDALSEQLNQRSDEAYHLSLQLEELKKALHTKKEEEIDLEKEMQEGLKRKEALLSDYHKTIIEQRGVIEKKQSYIAKLEEKVSDLMYEIRSLLQLEETRASSLASFPVVDDGEGALDEELLKGSVSPFDLAKQLQRYIHRIQNVTGVDHLGYLNGRSPRFLDASTHSYAVDLRPLFDLFQEEAAGIVFVYSRAEEKFLFINHFVKVVLGWSAEKMMKDFPELIEEGLSEWNQALSKLPHLKEAQLKLTLRSKMGEEIFFQCAMGLVSQGPFTNHAIGLLAPLSTY